MPQLQIEPEWNGPDSFDILCHVLPGRAVAAGRRRSQNPPFVDQTDREAVKFQLAEICPPPIRFETLQSLLPLAHFRFRKSVAKREHRRAMPHFPKFIHRLPSDPLGG